MNFRIDVHFHNEMAESAKLDQILTKLGAIEAQNVRILMNEADMKAALDKIDVATTKIGDNLTVVSGVAGTISTEVDALVAALQNAGVPQSLIDQATALGTKADAVVAATDALVPVLQGIASKANNVVPIPVPPPPPPPPGA